MPGAGLRVHDARAPRVRFPSGEAKVTAYEHKRRRGEGVGGPLFMGQSVLTSASTRTLRFLHDFSTRLRSHNSDDLDCPVLTSADLSSPHLVELARCLRDWLGRPLLRSRVAPTASATASPSIGIPRMIPKIGPGNDVAVKNSVLIKAYTTPTTPLTASSPATTKDLRCRETANAAIARTATPMPGPWSEPGPQRPTHRYDDDEHDERRGGQSDCQCGPRIRHDIQPSYLSQPAQDHSEKGVP
jgi:hypothetical protein